jgi:CDP-paratose 2-epimerase
VAFEDWRTGDQRYYVSDTRRFEAATGWRPHVNAREGIGKLYNWLAEIHGAAVPLGEPLVAVGRHA